MNAKAGISAIWGPKMNHLMMQQGTLTLWEPHGLFYRCGLASVTALERGMIWSACLLSAGQAPLFLPLSPSWLSLGYGGFLHFLHSLPSGLRHPGFHLDLPGAQPQAPAFTTHCTCARTSYCLAQARSHCPYLTLSGPKASCPRPPLPPLLPVSTGGHGHLPLSKCTPDLPSPPSPTAGPLVILPPGEGSPH